MFQTTKEYFLAESHAFIYSTHQRVWEHDPTELRSEVTNDLSIYMGISLLKKKTETHSVNKPHLCPPKVFKNHPATLEFWAHWSRNESEEADLQNNEHIADIFAIAVHQRQGQSVERKPMQRIKHQRELNL